MNTYLKEKYYMKLQDNKHSLQIPFLILGFEYIAAI